MWIASQVSWHSARNVVNAKREILTTNEPYVAKCWEAAVEQMSTRSWVRCRAQLNTSSECAAHWILNPLPCHMAGTANYIVVICFGWRLGHGLCVSGAMARLSWIFNVISQWDVICVPSLLHVGLVFISVNTMWQIIICLYSWKGRTHRANVLESKSISNPVNMYDIHVLTTSMRGAKCYISDKRY